MELIESYESEIRQLEFKIDKTKETISNLKKDLKGSNANSNGKKRGRPRKEASESDAPKTTRKKRGRPRTIILKEGDPTAPGKPKKIKKAKSGKGKKEKVKLIIPKASKRKPRSSSGSKKGYRLSEWDQFVLETLEKNGKVMINSELYDLALEKNKNENLQLSDDDVRGKLVRSIHKLANKRMEIAKAPFSGKGFSYGLASWFTSGGNLKKTYSR